MRPPLFAALMTVGLSLMAGPAAAGGWWSYVDLGGDDIAVGETLTARSTAFFTSIAEAEAAQDVRYFAYLVSDHDRELLDGAMSLAEPDRWWAPAKDARLLRVGRARITDMAGNVGRAAAKIRVPEMPSGRYVVMFCDARCRRPLGHVIPTDVSVTDDPVAAQAARTAESLAERNQQRNANVDAQLRTTHRQLLFATGSMAGLRASQEALQEQLDALAAEGDRGAPWQSLAGAFFAGVGAAAFLGGGVWLAWRRAARRRRADEQARWRPPPPVTAVGRIDTKPFEPAPR